MLAADLNLNNHLTMHTPNPCSRRNFLKTGAALSAASVFAPTTGVFAAGSDTMRIALIGCGTRGTGAAKDCLKSSPGVEIVALADLFQDKLDKALESLKNELPAQVKIKPDNAFLGFDAYKTVLAMSEVNLVLLATPPAFRPEMVRATIEAGKHIFMEKPGAVDPVGIRSLMQSADLADQRKLSIVGGTQQRYIPHYLEILKRIHGGDIGPIVSGQSYWNWGSSDWHFEKRKPEWSDVEWQIRCWPYFVWLSGDHIVEQHLHNMDVINWGLGAHPVECLGFGGRQARTAPDYGNIYDHFTIDYVYPEGVRVMSMCSQVKGSHTRVGERFVGTRGTAWMNRNEGWIEGGKPFKWTAAVETGLVAEHAALIKSIRDRQPVNEARRLAESTLTVIMGRMAAYTGKVVTWDFARNQSQIDLRPKQKLELGPLPVPPVAIPGQGPLI